MLAIPFCSPFFLSLFIIVICHCFFLFFFFLLFACLPSSWDRLSICLQLKFAALFLPFNYKLIIDCDCTLTLSFILTTSHSISLLYSRSRFSLRVSRVLLTLSLEFIRGKSCSRKRKKKKKKKNESFTTWSNNNASVLVAQSRNPVRKDPAKHFLRNCDVSSRSHECRMISASNGAVIFYLVSFLEKISRLRWFEYIFSGRGRNVRGFEGRRSGE